MPQEVYYRLLVFISMKQRLHYMDWAKVFGLYLIVLGHYIPNYTTSPIAIYIYTFHVPLFFIVSGFFAKNTCFHDMKKIYTTLLLPYVSLVLIEYALDILLCGLYAHNIPEKGYLMIIGDPAGLVNPMWFVFSLLIVRFLWILENKIGQATGKHGITFLIFFLLLLLTSHLPSIPMPSFAGRIIIAYLLYYIGYLIAKSHLFDSSKIYYLIFLIIIPILGMHINGNIDVYSFNMGNSVILFLLFSILSSIGWISLFKCALNIYCKFTETIAVGSLLIVAFHKFFLRIVFPSFENNILFQLIIPLIVILLLYYPIKITQKYVPFLLGHRKI